jgi:hypothetical protein
MDVYEKRLNRQKYVASEQVDGGIPVGHIFFQFVTPSSMHCKTYSHQLNCAMFSVLAMAPQKSI